VGGMRMALCGVERMVVWGRPPSYISGLAKVKTHNKESGERGDDEDGR